MKTKILLLVTLFFISMNIFSQQKRNTYDSEWKKVFEQTDKKLPKSAIKEAENILNKAKLEKNTPQMVKAYVCLDVLNREIDFDTETNLIPDLEVLITKTQNKEEQALIHSLLASEYYNAYMRDRWNINRRTNLSDDIPTDIKEWSANIFEHKILEHINASIENKDALNKSTSKFYDDIIKLGSDSKVYRPTLYDFIMTRAIDLTKSLRNVGNKEFDLRQNGLTADQLLLPAKDYIKLEINKSDKYIIFNYYQNYLNDLLARNLTGSVVLLEMDKYNYLQSYLYNLDSNKKLKALYAYEKAYNKDETTVEIIDKIVEEKLSQYNWQYPNHGYDRVDVGLEERQKEAYKWIQKGLEKYPNYKRIWILQRALERLEEPGLRIEGKNIFYGNGNVVLDIKHKNNQASKGEKTLDLYKIEDGKETFLKTYTITYVSKRTYNEEEAKLELGTLPYGKYFLKSKLNKEKSYNKERLSFSVSDLFTYHRNSAENEYEIVVVNRKNGKPIAGAEVIIYEATGEERKPNTKVVERLTTNQDGIAIYKDRTTNNRRYNKGVYAVHSEADTALPDQSLYESYYPNYVNEDNKHQIAISTFTDRTIYRPGQTLYFKQIVLDQNSMAIANKSMNVKLYNPYGEVIAEKNLATNEYGSVSGEFIIPKGGLLGSYYISTENSHPCYVQVEEYKRPTFDVKFDTIQATYNFGDKIVLRGNAKTFSGISLQNVDVKYHITRQVFSFWYWNTANGDHFQDGTVTTQDDGSFEIEFIPEAGDGQKLWGRNIYTFAVTAEITDLNGETQASTYNISVGDVSMMMNIEMPAQIEKSSDFNILIGAKNLDGKEINTSGSYQIFTVNQKDSIESQVANGQFTVGQQKELANKIKNLSSGKHRIILKANDDKDREVTHEFNFVLFSYNDKKPPYDTEHWIASKRAVFDSKKAAEIIFGTSREDVYILYQVYNNKEVFDRKYLKFNNENRTFKLAYDPKYGEEVYMSFTSVIDGKLSTQNILLKKEEEIKDTQLNIKAGSFRDRLRPGQEEEWTLSISNSDNKPAIAELLASMYDTSLDKITPYLKWQLQRPYIYKEYLKEIRYNPTQINTQSYHVFLKYDAPKITAVNFSFDELITKDWFNIGPKILLEETVVVGYGSAKKRSITGAVSSAISGKVAGVMTESVSTDQVNFTPPVLAAEAEAMLDEVVMVKGEVKGESEVKPQVRQNFNETAFFYPQLKTNDKGQTLISFIVPESNTTWRFRALAHDKEGKVGELEKMVVTRKELMVTPNMPRFVRQGDKTSISTKVSNLSENPISGDVKVEFFNPLDENSINLNVENSKQAFNLAKDASSSVSWTFDIPLDIELLGIRIVAQSESFSDGEQHALAVLPNRMLVTETMPVNVNQKGEQVFVMDKLSNNSSESIVSEKLTFEFASNPAWYAVQALPTMSNPSNENTINWFASYYVNTLGSSLMKQYPKVANMIKAWKASGNSKETLLSKLNKNEELKTILLEETPWVLDANNETEQMERLSLLFDLNNTKQQTSAAIQKLEELQLDEGAWSWYKGMYPSRGITQYLLFGFANLQRLGMVEYPEEVKIMQINALKYVDEIILKDFGNLKKHNKNWQKKTNITTSQLEYLYVRAMYRDIPISQEAREAERFYTSVVSKNWTKLNLYEKSLLAVLAKELGDKELADSLTKSIREYAVTNDELGMYWPNNKNNVFVSMSAVCSHIFAMEALIANGASKHEIGMMKRWLIKQKQTQVWENTNATIHAISILLQDNEDWFDGTLTPNIKVGDKKIKAENKELGTGYVKTSWSASEIEKDMGTVTIVSKDDKPAYGSLYWQYYEDLDKIAKQDGSLNINKELYREIVGKDGKMLEKITEEKPLKVGDKVIVRLVIRSDRDIEFVQIKDMRASCFEPQQTTSGMGYQNGLPYYQTTKDASSNFFFDVMPKGTYVLEYAVYANRTGKYANGITSIQCVYAPEFTAHSAGVTVTVE